MIVHVWKLSHVKQMAAVMCLLVWVLLQLTPQQLSSMVQSHVLTSDIFGSAVLLKYATTASRPH